MRMILLALSVLVLSARAADTPLSDVLIAGKGWESAGDTMFDFPKELYKSKKDDKGRWGIYRDGELMAQADDGEEFGDLALSPRGGRLVVGVPSHHHIYAFQVREDGSLYAREKTYALRREKAGKGGSGVKFMIFDAKGRLFVAVPEGIAYFDEEMRFSGLLSRPEPHPVRFVFLAGDTLFASCGAGVWKRTIKAHAPK